MSHNSDTPDNCDISLETVAETLHRVIGPSLFDEIAFAHKWPETSVEILVQPAAKELRFRYVCEGRSAGSIRGVCTSNYTKTYPTIRVNNYEGPITIRVSCVTKDFLIAHPNGLVGDHCTDGVFLDNYVTTAQDNTYQFTKIGIQYTRTRDVVDALRKRESIGVDPFNHGFHHLNRSSVDRSAVRLAFEVFLCDENGQRLGALKPVASDIIYDKKSVGKLIIEDASHDSGPTSGGTRIILLCDKVSAETQVQFYEKDDNGTMLWSSVVAPTLVHKNVALKVTTPKYTNLGKSRSQKEIPVQYRLIQYEKDKTTGQTKFQCGGSHLFTYILDVQDVKRRKTLLPCLQEYEEMTSTVPRSSPSYDETLIVPKTEPQQHRSSKRRSSSSTNPFMEIGCDVQNAGGPPVYGSDPPPYVSGLQLNANYLSSIPGGPPSNASYMSSYADSPASNASFILPCYGDPPSNASYISSPSNGPPSNASYLSYASESPSNASCFSPNSSDSPWNLICVSSHEGGPPSNVSCASSYPDSPPPYTTHDLSNMVGYIPFSEYRSLGSLSGTPPFERHGSPNASIVSQELPGEDAAVPFVMQCSAVSISNACTQTRSTRDARGSRPHARRHHPHTRLQATTTEHLPASLLDTSPPHPALQSPMTPTLQSPPNYQMVEKPHGGTSSSASLPATGCLVEVPSAFDSSTIVEDGESLSEVLDRLSTNPTNTMKP